MPTPPTAELTPNLAAARDMLATIMQRGDDLPDELQLAVIEAYAETEYRESLPFPPAQPAEEGSGLTVETAIDLCRQAHSLLISEIASSQPPRAAGLTRAAQQLAIVIDADAKPS